MLFLPLIDASEEYSFEVAEELTPLIDWREYGPAAFEEAITQNKPIFLLLTAPSWCYWCQVYESEDYLFHPDMVAYINQYTIPIYVDADQRYDLTRQYLEGGWPSTTIMTPSRERLYGYSGPRPVENMLANLENAVDHVNNHESKLGISYNYDATDVIIPTTEELIKIIESYFLYNLKIYDEEYGGFGTGQKFPQGRTLDFSLELYEETDDVVWLDLVQNTLKNQYTDINEIEIDYNLFDPVEGGFHRYGTERDWTPPHYEKMLYDNARLLKAYYHLQSIVPNDPLINEVVNKTIEFIDINWYDSVNGGFYGNSDVNGEDAYYGKILRSGQRARVEKTKYTNWNAEAILTYLYLYELSGEDTYKQMAKNSLDFFAEEMVTESGAYHYEKDGEKSVRGTLLDNSYLLLAFIEGYEVLGNQEYLDVSIQLADYALENLYDWNSSGFFERNSRDLDLYAPGENVLLKKPMEENGIISYALLKLYMNTKDPLYLNVGIKTIGVKIKSIGGLDSGYYFVKGSQYAIENNLIDVYLEIEEEITEIEKEKQDTFWLNELLSESDFAEIDSGLEKLDAPLILLIIVAIIAGFISFASPCTLPIIPAFVAYSFKSFKKNIMGMTVSFFIGLSILFTLLGASAGFVGNFLNRYIQIFSTISGIALILFGVYILMGKGFGGLKIKNTKPTTYFGSFLFGMILGLAWTPCVGPILVAILLLASTSGTVFSGGLLLLVYSFGFAVPMLLISYYLNKTGKKGILWKIIRGREFKISKKFSIHSSSLISGLIFVVLGYLIITGKLVVLNQYLGSTFVQNIVLYIEEFMLRIIG
jgi:uncharacterized protein YyaL (SSP411 family)/cytochrome c biogenesis protein CcdA